MQNRSCENVFRLRVHFYVNQTNFRMKGFVPGCALKPRHKVSRRRPIDQVVFDFQTLVKNSPQSVVKKMIPSGITEVQDFSPDRVTV